MAGGRSRAGASPTVLLAGVLLSGSAKAQSYTRAHVGLSVGLAARGSARSSLRGNIPSAPPALAARAGGRSSARGLRTVCAAWDAGASIWDDGGSDWDCPAIVAGRMRAMSRAEAALITGAPVVTHQYAVNIMS